MLNIYLDADACPVKEEAYRVARRHGLKVFVVSNAAMRVPVGDWLEAVVLPNGYSAVDDWVAEHAGPGDIVVMADIPLAERRLKTGAGVLGPKGHAFTEDSIGAALATRTLMDELRQAGEITGGPAPMAKQDRSRFLSRLDEMIHAARRSRSG